MSEQQRDPQSLNNRIRLRIVAGITLVIGIAILVVLTQLGPVVGNVFSDIVTGFGSQRTPVRNVETTAVANQTDIAPTGTPRPTRDGISLATAAQGNTTAIAERLTEQAQTEVAVAAGLTNTPTPPPAATASPSPVDANGSDEVSTSDLTATRASILLTRTVLAERNIQIATQGAQTQTAVAQLPPDEATAFIAAMIATDNASIGPDSPLTGGGPTTAAIAQATANAATESALTLPTADAVATETRSVAQASETARGELAASPTPPRIAELPVVVRSAEGAEVGNGRLRVFHADAVSLGQTFVVELQLSFDNYYITPTPRGPRTVVPAPTPMGTATPLAVDNRPTPTPRILRFESDPGSVEFFERMGASLLCLPSSFTGCDEGRNPDDARRITLDGVEWSWLLQPQQTAFGSQELTLEVWRPTEDSTEIIDAVQLAIDVVAPHDDIGLAAVAGATALLVAVLVGLFALRGRRGTTPKAKDPNAPQVFISYRRGVSAGYANMLHDRLEAKGAAVFLDVDDIHAGSFSETIRQNIMDAAHFVVVLAPGTLDSEWVRKEIDYARELNKVMIPVLVNSFDLYGDDLPEAYEFLKTQQSVTLLPQYIEAAVDLVAKYIGLAQD